MRKILFLLFFFVPQVFAQEKLYLFLSLSMPDQALRDYFAECQQFGGEIKIRGVESSSNLYEALLSTYSRIYNLGIDVEIDPDLFTKFGIVEVPTIVRIQNDHVERVTGHISLKEALRIFEEEKCLE